MAGPFKMKAGKEGPMTIEGAETAINGSVKHFTDKLEATKGPKVVKTFE